MWQANAIREIRQLVRDLRARVDRLESMLGKYTTDGWIPSEEIKEFLGVDVEKTPFIDHLGNKSVLRGNTPNKQQVVWDPDDGCFKFYAVYKGL